MEEQDWFVHTHGNVTLQARAVKLLDKMHKGPYDEMHSRNLERYQQKLDGIGPVDNRPSTDYLHTNN